ncbi:MAG: hypothetical protein AAF611_15345 [Bacteroidota bacterium]
MKKRSLNNLRLNKASISSLQFLYGGYEEQQAGEEGPADGPAPIQVLSIGKQCSKDHSCKRVCGADAPGCKTGVN